jgi:RNA polymerase sigma-70 factor, ECF subfamily
MREELRNSIAREPRKGYLVLDALGEELPLMLEPPEISLLMPSGATAAATTANTAARRGSSHLEEEVVDLFGQLRAPLLRYVAGIGLPPQDGEEIVQEAFLALFQHLRQGKSRANLRGWVFRVAHNLALKRRVGLRSKEAAGAAEELAVDLAADPGPSPEYLAASRQTQARLRGVMRALPEQERQCLVLRAEGLRYREIAQVLDMSLGAVSISLTRSLARLARAVQPRANK